MRVCIATKHKDWTCEHTGKGRFLNRLIPALQALGVEIVEPGQPADINLAVGKNVWKSTADYNIIRLGDAHKEKGHKKLNKRKWKAVQNADGVIYQSKYSQRLCETFIGKPDCPTAVIFNGADPKEFDVAPFKSKYKYNFMASARVWTPQKRLQDIKDAFVSADIDSSALWIVGGNKRFQWGIGKRMNIEGLGLVSTPVLASLYKLCNALIDITWLSACPNSVVEALVAGCPVISGNDGGIHELGWNDRLFSLRYSCIGSDALWNGEVVDLSKPPPFYQHGLIENIKGMAYHKKPEFTYKALHISNIAKQYLEFFKEVSGGI